MRLIMSLRAIALTIAICVGVAGIFSAAASARALDVELNTRDFLPASRTSATAVAQNVLAGPQATPSQFAGDMVAGAVLRVAQRARRLNREPFLRNDPQLRRRLERAFEPNRQRPRTRNPYRAKRPGNYKNTVPPSDAIQAARARVNGKLLGIRRANRYGTQVYVVKMMTAQRVHEVVVDMETGQVME